MTIGEEAPAPGMASLHLTFSVAENSVGALVPSGATPVPAVPRNRSQSSATAFPDPKTVTQANQTLISAIGTTHRKLRNTFFEMISIVFGSFVNDCQISKIENSSLVKSTGRAE